MHLRTQGRRGGQYGPSNRKYSRWKRGVLFVQTPPGISPSRGWEFYLYRDPQASSKVGGGIFAQMPPGPLCKGGTRTLFLGEYYGQFWCPVQWLFLLFSNPRVGSHREVRTPSAGRWVSVFGDRHSKKGQAQRQGAPLYLYSVFICHFRRRRQDIWESPRASTTTKWGPWPSVGGELVVNRPKVG